MEAVQRGGDRQAVHERLRIHARTAATMVLEEGGTNPFLELDALIDPVRCVGRAPQQVREFLAEHVQPILDEAGELPQAKDLDV